MEGHVKIVYIGAKDRKRDTVAGTRSVWNGYGSVQFVAQLAAQTLLMYPTVWVDEKAFNELPKADTPGLHSVSPVPAAPEPGGRGPAFIQEAIRKLERTNPDHFGSFGAPKVDAVRALLPGDFDLSAKDLQEAFSEIAAEFRV